MTRREPRTLVIRWVSAVTGCTLFQAKCLYNDCHGDLHRIISEMRTRLGMSMALVHDVYERFDHGPEITRLLNEISVLQSLKRYPMLVETLGLQPEAITKLLDAHTERCSVLVDEFIRYEKQFRAQYEGSDHGNGT